MSYYPIYQRAELAPYHARQPMPLFDIYRWIKGAQEGQSFIVRDGTVGELPVMYRLWLEVWEDEGFITYETVKASPMSLSSANYGCRIHVTRTEKNL